MWLCRMKCFKGQELEPARKCFISVVFNINQTQNLTKGNVEAIKKGVCECPKTFTTPGKISLEQQVLSKTRKSSFT